MTRKKHDLFSCVTPELIYRQFQNTLKMVYIKVLVGCFKASTQQRNTCDINYPGHGVNWTCM